MLALQRGQDLKAVMRAAAAMVGLHDDKTIAEAMGISRNTVGDWWMGATPGPDNLRTFARISGLALPELRAFVYDGADPPTLDWTSAAVLRAAHRDRSPLNDGDPGTLDEPPP